jgi:hypothetical protein
MVSTSGTTSRAGAMLGGVGGIAFGLLTLGGTIVANAPGGSYSASSVSNYLAHGHRIVVLVITHLALVGVLGLVALLAYLRDAITVRLENRAAGNIVWGAGLVAAASYAIGWAVIGGQVVAHLEGGAIAIPAPLTYLISEIGVMFIFGAGSIMLGFALITLMVSSRGVLPNWVRRVVLLSGLCGVAGLAFFPFFLLMICVAIVGVWLVAAGRQVTTSAAALESPSAL